MLSIIRSSKDGEMEARLAALDKSQAVIEFDTDGNILTANENFLNTMGYRLDEVQGKHHSMFVAPEDRSSAAYKDFWAQLKAGHYQSAQYRRFGKGGKEVWIEASYNPLIGRDGKTYKVVKYATDITASKAEFSDLRGQVNAIGKSQAVIEFDLDGKILTANENFLSTLGYSLGEVQGKHHSMFVSPEDRGSEAYKRFWQKLRSGEYEAGQFKRYGKGGKEVWIEASYNPIFDAAGRPFKVVKYATDITSQISLLTDLKAMIDTNFAEIDSAVDRAEGEAANAGTNAERTSANVQTVAAAVEELVASIGEIAQSMVRSKMAGEEVQGKVEAAHGSTERLAAAASAMTGIVELIQEIAGQINLLALNATIEAARAGEAGKGFAVVASEVKNLAGQAAKATDHISKEITGIQSVSSEVVEALQSIREGMETVRDHVTSTSAAVEEQSVVTGNISEGMQDAARSVEEITASMSGISAAIAQVGGAVASTRQAAEVLAR